MEKAENRNEIEEIANITYQRLVALMDDRMIKAAVQNEAWELVEVLVRILRTSSDIPSEKVRKYASAIMEFTKAMYIEKIVDFPDEHEIRKYQHCDDIIRLWMDGKALLLKNLQQDTPARGNI